MSAPGAPGPVVDVAAVTKSFRTWDRAGSWSVRHPSGGGARDGHSR